MSVSNGAANQLIVMGVAIYSVGASRHDLTLMPLNNMIVGVDKIDEVARIPATFGTLNCESPHVTHIPHLRLLVGFRLGLSIMRKFILMCYLDPV